MKLTSSVDISNAIKKLDLADKQVRFAAAVALTRTAQAVKVAQVDEMKRVFDRPTNYTLNSLFVRGARPNRLDALVWVKDDAGKGIPATKYLLPQVEGGQRSHKRFEKALINAGVLPYGMFAVPGDGAEVDAFGNIQRGQIVRVLAYFRAFGQQGYSANITDKRKASLAKGSAKRGVRGISYFSLRERRGKLPPGIYSRTSFGAWGSAIKPIMIFVTRPQYQRAWDFYATANRVASERFELEFERSKAEALATARA